MKRLLRTLLAAVVSLSCLVLAHGSSGDPLATVFTLDNGVQVVLRRNPGSDIVALRTLIIGGTRNTTAQTAGIEALWLDVASRGGQKYPREQLLPLLEQHGIAIGGGQGKDYSSFSLRCLKDDFPLAMDIYADLLLRPALDPQDVELTRRRMMAAQARLMEQPDGRLSRAINDAYYQGHPYLAYEGGTDTSLSGVTIKDIRAHMTQALTGSRLVVAVVGDLSPKNVQDLLQESLGAQPRGDAPPPSPPAFTPQSDRFPLWVDMAIPATYIMGKFSAPATFTDDGLGLDLAMDLLSDKLWDAVRTDEGLAYAVAAGLASAESNYGYFYISTTSPARAMEVIRSTVATTIKKGFTDLEVEDGKNIYRTRYYLQLETAADQAGVMLWSHRYQPGGWQGGEALLKPLDTFDAARLRALLERYVTNIHWGALGVRPAADEPPPDFFVAP